jgi:outer membrane protein assembly factor BamB
VVLAGHAYGFCGRAGDNKTALRCLDLATGEVKWSQVLGFGSLMAADGKLIVLTELGRLSIVDATPAGYMELTKVDSLLSKKCWTVPVLCGGRIYCRNEKGDLVCVDVSR